MRNIENNILLKLSSIKSINIYKIFFIFNLIPRILKFKEYKTSITLPILYNYKTLLKKNKFIKKIFNKDIQRHKK